MERRIYSRFGDVSGEKFVPFVETGKRDFVREDRLHRQRLIESQAA
jgi:hypothetical protein